MKHFSLILTLIGVAFSFVSVHADEATPSIDFSYAGKPYGAGGYSEPSYKGGAMLLTEDVTARYAGCRIIEVSIANGKFCNQSEAPVEIFFTKNLNEKAYYSVSGNMDIDCPLEYKTYPLSQPVEIQAGQPFYVGFVTWAAGVAAPNYECSFPVYTDGVLHTDLPGGYIAFSETTGVPEKMTWNDEGYSGGQVCIRLRIEGDNLPQNVAELSFTRMPDYINPFAVNYIGLKVQNQGVNPINDIDLSYSIFGETQTRHFDFPNEIGYEFAADMELEFITTQEGVNVPVSFTIEKVNGVTPSATATATVTAMVHSILPENGFNRKMVVEEAGGSGCGWCVRGIVGLNHMFRNYGNEAFIPISAHSSGYGEEKAPFGYDAFWERYITHNPSCLINRNISSYGIADPNADYLDWVYSQLLATRAMADIRISGCHEENDWLSVDSEVWFAFPEENGAYSVAYVVTEDGVGPYMQYNSYSDVDYEMGGWELLPSPTPTYYDFLARGISNFDGTPLSSNGAIEVGKTYSHSDKVNLVKVRDRYSLAVIALLINDKTGRIENAARLQMTDLDAVDTISSDHAPAEYYDLSGHRMTVAPTSGIYIERKGGKARKIAATPH